MRGVALRRRGGGGEGEVEELKVEEEEEWMVGPCDILALLCTAPAWPPGHHHYV